MTESLIALADECRRARAAWRAITAGDDIREQGAVVGLPYPALAERTGKVRPITENAAADRYATALGAMADRAASEEFSLEYTAPLREFAEALRTMYRRDGLPRLQELDGPAARAVDDIAARGESQAQKPQGMVDERRPPQCPKQQKAITERRAKVAALWESGERKFTAIASSVYCNRTTVVRDLKALGLYDPKEESAEEASD